MFSVDELLPYYPENQRTFREFILREYLQYKILQIVFGQADYAHKLCFLGGTCLRIVHGNTRFSEDIDFDNFGLTEKDFQAISEVIKKELEREGYKVEMKTVYKGAFHCHIQFPGLLFKEGLTGHREQKILIQLDTEPQHFAFQPETHILNKFDVFTEIPVTPLNLLLAQKFYTIVNRKRSKGRDFFDAIFLLSKEIKPNYDYLRIKLGIGDPKTLKAKIRETCSKLDMKAMADDVAPFLFNATDAKKVESFETYLKQVEF
ncbi:MAG TPA: nucleotidyl transferase AbiEii/AbiGii toxin family protein [Cyclobacteriaceae bacterium]|nr:nucleotidyl transferase AbiEii/AbiGii toxin family protein [Cyclobacteriaceae bacterium]